MKINSVKLLMTLLSTNRLPKVSRYKPNFHKKEVNSQMIKQLRMVKVPNKKVSPKILSRLRLRM